VQLNLTEVDDLKNEKERKKDHFLPGSKATGTQNLKNGLA
jgi:hypothetical protein